MRDNAAVQDVQGQDAKWRQQVVANGADSLWEDVVAKVAANIEEFAKELPAATHLRADRLNSNNLAVQTIVRPLIKIEIIRTPGSHVQADIMKLPNALRAATVSQTNKFYFTEPDGSVEFTDRERLYAAQELANGLCQIAADFFDPKSRRWSKDSDRGSDRRLHAADL